MLYIKKGREPKSLTEYKKIINATYDGYRDKDDVRKALMDEQNGLCAYCMCKLKDVSDVQIEHYIPQSECGEQPHLALSYTNMLGVCNGGTKSCRDGGKERLTCDAHRGNTPLTIDPWNPSIIDKIEYLHDGTIFSKDHNIDKDLDETLNLNSPFAPHKNARKTTLNKLIASMKDTIGNQNTWSRTRLQKILNRILEANPKPPYCGILIYYLRKRIKL